MGAERGGGPRGKPVLLRAIENEATRNDIIIVVDRSHHHHHLRNRWSSAWRPPPPFHVQDQSMHSTAHFWVTQPFRFVIVSGAVLPCSSLPSENRWQTLVFHLGAESLPTDHHGR